MADLTLVEYIAPPAIGITYVAFLRATRQQLVRSSFDALGAYLQGVGIAYPDARSRLDEIAAHARPSQHRLKLLRGLNHDSILGAWRVARALELQYVHTLPRADTIARLISIAATLGGDDHAARRDLAVRIRKLVDPPQGIPAPTDEELHAMLREAMRQDFDARDTLYESLAYENLRASWLADVGLGFAVVLALSLGHAELFAAGAAGGLLSRLARVLRGRPLPNDYGASWGTLMLSPVAGALAGWLGVLFIGALADGGLDIFASGLAVSWAQDPDGVELGIAFLLGFSERLFTSTVTSTTERLLPTPEAPLGPAPQGSSQTAVTP